MDHSIVLTQIHLKLLRGIFLFMVLLPQQSLNPCGLTAERQCSQWPREYLKVPTSSLSEDQYSSILVVGADGAKNIDYERERSFSILVGVRDGFALTATGTLDIQVLNVNERPVFRSAINKTVYFLLSTRFACWYSYTISSRRSRGRHIDIYLRMFDGHIRVIDKNLN